ncbi:rod shape-determining protein MreD [Wenyingzhuangia sp. 1_MG-2023]|nr:rod shape-determining protein MreD [Wenyingzhuangia sp. 1_MG-2023]
MNNNIKIILRAVILILSQVLIGNQMRIFDYINPQWCILFVLWYPIRTEKSTILLPSFLFGLALDFFGNSGGINAASFTLIAFLRLSIFKRLLSQNELHIKAFKYNNYGTATMIAMVFSLAFLHHLMLFSLSYFDVSFAWTIVWKSFVSSIFTTFVTVVFISIFSPNK